MQALVHFIRCCSALNPATVRNELVAKSTATTTAMTKKTATSYTKALLLSNPLLELQLEAEKGDEDDDDE